ncbi:hypothetical protein M427DRAFT_32708 [Gonapodya prolifera JEL478]|uniref:Uncharacterized protein n=1 Tax=Gonapodya prolifera (strain JEL478) TaxID=1344416 RepID=A0A139AE03_GONPJ|nr:hypothetical protein M427DRAFT_32708 [Gonapodya prolifera JEL478]|eukprot:KXS14990.1 hypothetical protein M427DRAFT_32708 [Gonapodya prolifera JEL478]
MDSSQSVRPWGNPGSTFSLDTTPDTPRNHPNRGHSPDPYLDGPASGPVPQRSQSQNRPSRRDSTRFTSASTVRYNSPNYGPHAFPYEKPPTRGVWQKTFGDETKGRRRILMLVAAVALVLIVGLATGIPLSKRNQGAISTGTAQDAAVVAAFSPSAAAAAPQAAAVQTPSPSPPSSPPPAKTPDSIAPQGAVVTASPEASPAAAPQAAATPAAATTQGE